MNNYESKWDEVEKVYNMIRDEYDRRYYGLEDYGKETEYLDGVLEGIFLVEKIFERHSTMTDVESIVDSILRNPKEYKVEYDWETGLLMIIPNENSFSAAVCAARQDGIEVISAWKLPEGIKKKYGIIDNSCNRERIRDRWSNE